MSVRYELYTRLLPLLLLGSLTGCSGTPDSVPQAPLQRHDAHGVVEVPAGSSLRRQLSLQTLQLHQQPQWISAPALIQVDPAQSVSVLPPVAGRVALLAVALGQQVHRGQLLAVIASGDGAQAQTDVIKAHAAMVLAKQARARAQAVLQAGGAAAKDLQSARNDLQQARAELQRATERWQALGGTSRSPGGLELRAPIDGTVTSLGTAAGAFANDVTAPLMSVTRLDAVWATAQVDQGHLAAMKVGRPATVSVEGYPQRQWHGQVQVVDSQLDPDTRRDNVRIALANPDGALKPNMFAQAQIAAAVPASLFVPASALLMNNDQVSVFVQTTPWHFVRRSVQLGEDEGGQVRVLSGLQAGDKVVVAGGVLLDD